MVQLLGDNVVPDAVADRRRQFRERVRGLRQPVRNFREQNVPGPDIVGSAEDRLTDLRDRLVSRNTVLDRIRSRRASSSASSSSSSGDSSTDTNNDIGQMT